MGAVCSFSPCYTCRFHENLKILPTTNTNFTLKSDQNRIKEARIVETFQPSIDSGNRLGTSRGWRINPNSKVEVSPHLTGFHTPCPTHLSQTGGFFSGESFHCWVPYRGLPRLVKCKDILDTPGVRCDVSWKINEAVLEPLFNLNIIRNEVWMIIEWA